MVGVLRGMKARFCFILFAAVLCGGAGADGMFSVENHVSVGMRHQSLAESVFYASAKISEIRWQPDIVPSVTDELVFGVSRVRFSFGFSTAIPVKTGIVEDRDWLFSGSSALSNYSRHENYVDKEYRIYGTAAYAAPALFGRLFIRAGLGVRYDNEKYAAKNGYYQYPSGNRPVDSSTKKTYLCGTGMTYEVSAFMPFCFVDARVRIDERHSCFLSFDCFPYMIVDATDTHIMRLIEFYDSMRGGFGFKVATGYACRLTKQIALELSLSYSLLEISGTSSSRTIGDYAAFERESGVRGGLKKSCGELQVGFSYRLY
ncbi:MAG: omptin family outer membrane protease [Treponemataceae bacterium]|nr:omptin family outer membrane protease [Treponemataceae bacterium]